MWRQMVESAAIVVGERPRAKDMSRVSSSLRATPAEPTSDIASSEMRMRINCQTWRVHYSDDGAVGRGVYKIIIPV